ncbi:hypothetical protein ACFL0C_02050, partial [Patescibacteria group bacterium]
WNGNSFSLTLIICYSLAPLAFYLVNKIFFHECNKSDYLLMAILTFFMSFAFYLAIVFYLLTFLYLIVWTFKKKTWLSTFKKGLILVLLLIPIHALHFSLFYETIFGAAETINVSGGETYGFLSGGLLYPLLMWFSWGIYTVWSPRNILTYHTYLKLLPSIIAPFLFYSTLFVVALQKKIDKRIILLVICLVVSIFFAKGPQAPLGKIYLELIEKVPFFRVFRSPDNKFGFGVIFSTSLILLYTILNDKKKIVRYLILVGILVQALPFFTGAAVSGENTDKSSDRVIEIPSDTIELSEYFKKNNLNNSSIISFPPTDFTSFKQDNGSLHIGQDLVPKFSSKPFIYLTDYTSMQKDSFELVNNSLSTFDIQSLEKLPIRYYLFRKDSLKDNFSVPFKNTLEDYMPRVFENNLYEVYEANTYAELVESDADISYEVKRPYYIKVIFNDLVDNPSLYLNYSYNDNFDVYVGASTPFESSQKMHNGYANEWKINLEEIAIDDTMDFSITIFSRSQLIYVIGAYTSSLTLVIFILIIIYDSKNSRKI